MRKLLKLCSLIVLLVTLSGCSVESEFVSENVYTTIYPIEYLTDYLYGETKTVTSVYPKGADVANYKLTDKQKETYSKGALFVYNGLTGEKELAREFLNSNKDILLIDVSYGLNYDLAIEELWLSPNNYLMLAKNIKNNLIDYTTSKLVIDSIEAKYSELEETLSYMDANLRSIASLAASEGDSTLIVSSNKLKFLEKYGFEIINLDNKNISTSTLKSNFKNGKYKDIYLCDTDIESDLIKELKDKYEANVIDVNMMYTLSNEEASSAFSYETIMNELIENIRSTALS